VNRNKIVSSLKNYTSKFEEEKLFVKQFLDLLLHPAAFQRDHLPGHITGSSWILDRSRKFTLLTHHATLNKWLQPGGHADGEENVINVALREAEEETGLKTFTLLQDDIFDLDIHLIPARKGFPSHLHYDIRFLVEANIEDKIIVSEESHDVAWKSLNELKQLTLNNPSMMRMAYKTKSI
jgi:8-oxo-dGTP pyrophosphatase MutT (NUDIX family)